MKTFRLILRILGSLALVLYTLFIIDASVHMPNVTSFENNSVLLLFAVFLAGFVLSWKNELLAGILYVVWHGLQWALVFWVWTDGAMTLILGFPIAIIGILLIVYGIRKKIISSSTTRN